MISYFASAIVGVTAALAGWRRSFVWRARYLYLAAVVRQVEDQQYRGWMDKLVAEATDAENAAEDIERRTQGDKA